MTLLLLLLQHQTGLRRGKSGGMFYNLLHLEFGEISAKLQLFYPRTQGQNQNYESVFGIHGSLLDTDGRDLT